MVTQNLTPGSTALMAAVAARPGHVLLVEDDASIRDLVTMALEDEEYAVMARVTPLEATRLLDQRSFDLVIMDGFSTLPGAVIVNTADVARSAGSTVKRSIAGSRRGTAIRRVPGGSVTSQGGRHGRRGRAATARDRSTAR